MKSILEKALAKDIEHRFQTGAAFVEALEILPEEAIAKADEAAMQAQFAEEGSATSKEESDPGETVQIAPSDGHEPEKELDPEMTLSIGSSEEARALGAGTP